MEAQQSHEGITNEQSKTDALAGFGWKQLLLFFLTFIGFSFAFGIFIGFIGAIIEILTDVELFETNFINPVLLIIDGLSFFLALLCFKSIRTFLKDSFSFTPLKQGKTYLYFIASFIIILVTQVLFIEVLKIDDPTRANQTLGLEDTSIQWWSVLLFYFSIAIVTPIKEEILFRGIIHKFLQTKYRFWVGLVISSIIFGLLHLGYPITATIMGIVFVMQYRLTKSLVVPIVFHFIWNAYAVTVLLFLS